MKNHKNLVQKLLPYPALILTLILDTAIPESPRQVAAGKPYFQYLISMILVLYTVLFLLSFIWKKADARLASRGAFLCGLTLFICGINLIVSKYALLPVLFFPSLDRILEVYPTDWKLLLKCVLSSGQLLIIGFLIGGALGFFTGVLIGFSKKASYWIQPFMKFIGPIPATSWSPLVLSLFTTTYQAAVFMVALAVWFPITLMTSSGIANVKNAYFEVSQTLGAGKWTQIFRVGVPAAMPSIFLGIFYATCGSFTTLVTAELLGAESGLGWYLDWQKSMMLYANVYAGLILMAVICAFVLTMVFRLKDHLLVWQKGVIKW